MTKCTCKINPNKAKPLTYWLPFHYHLIPGKIRLWIAANIYADHVLSEIAELCSCQQRLSQTIKWPENKNAAFTLSFDIDSKSGFQKIIQLKKDPFYKKFKATVNLVSNTYKFTKEDIVLLASDGWEIGSHGDNHDSQLPYLPKKQIVKRLSKIIKKFKQYGISLKGIRSPSLLYTEDFFQCLEENFSYSSSTSYDDGPNSVRKIFPFYIGKLLELPISMPIDIGFKFLKMSDEEMISNWLTRFNYILENKGHILLVIHPDSHFFDLKMEKVLRQFLEKAKLNKTWDATCAEVADFFKLEVDHF